MPRDSSSWVKRPAQVLASVGPFVTLILPLWAIGCGQEDKWVPASSYGRDEGVLRWLTCDECIEGELEAVLKMGEAAVPELASALIDGPDSEVIDSYRQFLEEQYSRLADRAVLEGVGFETSRTEYVDKYVSNLIARYQIRAARALGYIGGNDAREALEGALSSQARDDVLATVQSVLDQM